MDAGLLHVRGTLGTASTLTHYKPVTTRIGAGLVALPTHFVCDLQDLLAHRMETGMFAVGETAIEGVTPSPNSTRANSSA